MSRGKEIVIKEHLANGLRPDPKLPVDAPYLEACTNLKCSPNGLVNIDVPIVAADSLTPSNDSRILVGESEVIVMDEDIGNSITMKKMTLSTRALGSDILSSGTTIDAYDNAGSVSFDDSLGSNWSFIEVNGVWFITNGEAWITTADAWFTAEWNGGTRDRTLGVASLVVPRGVCMYNDRFVACGMRSEHTAVFTGGTATNLATLWTDVWEMSKAFSEARGIFSQTDAMDASYVMIGNPSGGSHDMPFALEMMLLSGYKATNHGLVIDAFETGEMLFVKIPFKGEALAVEQLGDNIIVYGDHGVGLITPIRGDSTQAQIAVEYFDVVKILDVGIMSPSAHVGDRTQQTFIDTRGDMWRINAEGQLSKLGYREYFSALVTADVNMSFDSREGDIYISDEVTGYILTPSGLTKSRYVLNGILPYTNGILYGLWTVADSDVSTFLTHPMSMDSRRVKSVQNMSFELEGFNSPIANVDWQMGHGQAFNSQTGIALNFEGDVYPNTAGTSFKIEFSSGTIADGTPDHASLSNIKVRFKEVDKRRLRDLG